MPPTIHHRLAPAPERKQLPNRRRFARQRKRKSPPTLSKEQSTLTQLDFVDSSSSPHLRSLTHGRSIYSIPSVSIDDDDDDDSDYAEPRPKKRQRTKAPSSSKPSSDKRQKQQQESKKQVDADQSTMTQCWKLRNYAMDSEERESDNELEIMNEDHVDYGSEIDICTSAGRVRAGVETLDQAALLSANVEDGDTDEESVVTSSPPLKLPQHPALMASPNPGVDSTRPTTAASKVDPRTPQKNRILAIPSSQTPSSIKLSEHSPHAFNFYDRSSLNEWSTNMSPSKYSQTRTATKLPAATLKPERMGVGMDLETFQSMPHGHWNATIAFTPKKQVKHVAPTLNRATTIEDSEEGDVELFSPHRPRRSSKRTTGIHESQLDSHMLDLSAAIDDENHDQEHDDNDETHRGLACTYSSLMQQSTFDPVAAALDRDAARFGRTATQLQTQLQARLVTQLSKEEGDEALEKAEHEVLNEHASRGVVSQTEAHVADVAVSSQPELKQYAPSPELGGSPMTTVKVKHFQLDQPDEQAGDPDLVPSSQPDEKQRMACVHGVAPLAIESVQEAQADATSTDHLQRVCAKGNGKFAPQNHRQQTQPHPSQVSTVVPSQLSRPSSAHGPPVASPSTSGPRTFETLSSSPIPLPPWEDGDDSVRRNVETQGTLTDFSLPPPPSLVASSSL